MAKRNKIESCPTLILIPALILTIDKDIRNSVNVKITTKIFLSCIFAIKTPYYWKFILTYKLKIITYEIKI